MLDEDGPPDVVPRGCCLAVLLSALVWAVLVAAVVWLVIR